MEKFSSDLKLMHVTLRSAADIVQHSFIVQNSICALNLELSKPYFLSDKGRKNHETLFSYSIDLISTEEKCRKVHTSSRSLLYTLHLDLPHNKEKALRGNVFNTVHADINKEVYTNLLADQVDYACSKAPGEALKLLKWFIKSEVFVNPDISRLPDNITNRIVDYLHPEIYDEELVKLCFDKLLPSLVHFLFRGDPLMHGKRINLVYQLLRTGRDPQKSIWFEPPNAPSYGDISTYLMEKLGENWHWTKESEGGERRQDLLNQLLAFYMEQSTDPAIASEFLRVFWDSVNDPLLSSNEIATLMQKKSVSAKSIKSVCEFYSKAVSGLSQRVEPRPLQHFCRTVIRKQLNYKQRYAHQYVPDDIEKLRLPKRIKRYLNLDD